jgi:FkbM family methyltransferase
VTLPASQSIHADGVVHAFEPSQGNLKYLRFHLQRNEVSNVVVVPKLVGSVDSTGVPFFTSKEDSDMNSITANHLQAKGGYSQNSTAAIAIDSYCADNGLTPELMKIDVEGAEISVLEGAHRTLRESRPIMFLSVHPQFITELGRSITEIDDLLSDANYSVFDFDGNESEITESAGFAEYLVCPNLKSA